MPTVEIRCPVGPKRLFSKLQISTAVHITDDNLIEFACSDCKKLYRLKGEELERVLHRYNLLGQLIQTIKLRKI